MLLTPSKINNVFHVNQVRTFSKFGEGGPYDLLFHKFTVYFCVKFKFQRLGQQNPETREALKIFVISSLLYPWLEESVCNVIINDNQALLSIYFYHNNLRNKSYGANTENNKNISLSWKICECGDEKHIIFFLPYLNYFYTVF